MIDLKSELNRVAKQISEIICSDTYPNDIKPDELRAAVRSYPERGGKRLRPFLVMCACGMCGGDVEKAKYAAAATEIFHNWTLVHDDIIDCDSLRRGNFTCHTEVSRYCTTHYNVNKVLSDKYGNDLAILAGDLQQGWAVSMMSRIVESGVSAEIALALICRMQQYLNVALISGEGLDVSFEVRDHKTVVESDIMNMIYGKTSALLIYSVQCGAAIALNSTDFSLPQQEHLMKFAGNLGIAYQLLDDLLDVYGEPQAFGKPLCSDFKESKPTLLYIEAKKRMSATDFPLFESLIGLPFYSMNMIQTVRKLLTDCGAEHAVKERARELTESALKELEFFPESNYRDCLVELTKYLLDRNF